MEAAYSTETLITVKQNTCHIRADSISYELMKSQLCVPHLFTVKVDI
jgi:hypothetical protein